MGKMEKRRETRMRQTAMNKAIIGVIGVAGVLAFGLVAPNALGALGKMGLLPQLRYRATSALGRMIQKGYVRMEEKGGKRSVCLTEKGERFAALIREGGGMQAKPARWDGKWRIVMYDFHEPAGTLRARIRELLVASGFVLLQKSVWVYPYDVEDIIFILKQEYKIGRNLLYVIADDIENDTALRTHFSLPQRKN